MAAQHPHRQQRRPLRRRPHPQRLQRRAPAPRREQPRHRDSVPRRGHGPRAPGLDLRIASRNTEKLAAEHPAKLFRRIAQAGDALPPHDLKLPLGREAGFAVFLQHAASALSFVALKRHRERCLSLHLNRDETFCSRRLKKSLTPAWRCM